MWRLLPDGSRRYMSVSGEPRFDARGKFAGYRGIGRDITKQKRMQQLLKLQQAVTRRLAESESVPAALSAAFQAICEAEGWDNAEYWQHDAAAGTLRCTAHWSREGDAEARRFIEGSVNRVMKPGAGLVGTVYQTGEAMWLTDATQDPRGLRKALAERTGLRGATLLPVSYSGRVAGVVAFHSRRTQQPDKRLAQAFNAIATQIGAYLQRTEVEHAMRESEERFRSLTNLSSDWYWEQDTEFRFTRLEGRLVTGGDTTLRSRLIGSRRWDSGLQMEGGWDAHRAVLEAHQPFHDVVMWRALPDGSRRYMNISGEPLFAPDGGFAGYRGVGRDVTRQMRAEQLLKLEHRVARALAGAEDAVSGLRAIMRGLGLRTLLPSGGRCAALPDGVAGAGLRLRGLRDEDGLGHLPRRRRHCRTRLGQRRGGVGPGCAGRRSHHDQDGDQRNQPGRRVCLPGAVRRPHHRRAELLQPRGAPAGQAPAAGGARHRQPGRPVPAAQAGRDFAARERGALPQPDADVFRLLLGDRRAAPHDAAGARPELPQRLHGPRHHRQDRLGGALARPRRRRLGRAPRRARAAPAIPRLRVRARHGRRRAAPLRHQRPATLRRRRRLHRLPRCGARRHRNCDGARAHRFARLQRPADGTRQPHQPRPVARAGGAARAPAQFQAGGGVHRPGWLQAGE